MGGTPKMSATDHNLTTQGDSSGMGAGSGVPQSGRTTTEIQTRHPWNRGTLGTLETPAMQQW